MSRQLLHFLLWDDGETSVDGEKGKDGASHQAPATRGHRLVGGRGRTRIVVVALQSDLADVYIVYYIQVLYLSGNIIEEGGGGGKPSGISSPRGLYSTTYCMCRRETWKQAVTQQWPWSTGELSSYTYE